MTLVIGTDEAGYGPNLGPLVVAATAWQVDDPSLDAAAIARSVEEAVAEGSVAAGLRGPVWTDSKLVHRGPRGFAALERAALAGLVAAHDTRPLDGPSAAAAAIPPDWRTIDALLGGCPAAEPRPVEAAALDGLRLPVEADVAGCLRASTAVRAALAARGVRLHAIRCRVMQPGVFNTLLAAGLNKSDILSRTTLELAAALRNTAAEQPAILWCDRHGGRRSYAPLLTRHFDTPLVRVREETAACSAYELPAASCTVEFSVGGESRVPVALASLTAKYMRELAMRAFNAFWSGRAPALQPTAGYPVDAGRWRKDAADVVAAAGCDWDAVWRRA